MTESSSERASRLRRLAIRVLVAFVAVFIVLAIVRGMATAATATLPMLLAVLLVGAVTDGLHFPRSH